ncbi:MAG: MarR family transcriptional regulator [Pseudomonadota bacterium]
MKTDQASNLEIADELHSAAIHLLRVLRKQDAEAGLSAPKLSVLSVLAFGGTATLKTLAAVEQVSRPTMTKLIQELEADDMVKRQTNPDDRRNQLISITAKGKSVFGTARRKRLDALARQVADLSKSDRQAVVKAIAPLRKLSGRS